MMRTADSSKDEVRWVEDDDRRIRIKIRIRRLIGCYLTSKFFTSAQSSENPGKNVTFLPILPR
jgi:hypothetical protein